MIDPEAAGIESVCHRYIGSAGDGSAVGNRRGIWDD